MDDRIDALEARLARIEEALIAQRIMPAPVITHHDALPEQPAVVTTPPTPPAPSRATASASDAERFVGGRVLLAVGAFALLLGVAFFLKYAFDNGWIGPAGRVVIGLLAGAGMLLGSERLRTMSQPVFAQGVTALAAGVLYLSLWAAGNGFHLVSIGVTFVAMCIVTAFLILLATRRDSELTAAWGMIGGFITPALNAGPSPSYTTLFIYLALLDAAIIFVPSRKSWNRIAPVALIITQFYFLVSIGGDTNREFHDLGFATIFLVLFMIRPAMKAFARERFDAADLAVVVLAAISYYTALHWQLYDAHRLVLVAAIVLLAGGYLVLAERSTATPRSLFAALALALATGGIAVAFSGATVAALWAIEGALLAWAGARSKLAVVQIFAAIAFAIGLLYVTLFPLAGGRVFVNDRFITLLIFGLSFAAVRLAGIRYAEPSHTNALAVYRIAEIAAHICVVTAFSYEFWTLGHGNELALTLFWLFYGALLLALGFVRNSMFVRIEALGLLALAVGKAFVVDMSEVDPAVRIISFLVLGSVLLAASYVYLRSRQSATEAPR